MEGLSPVPADRVQVQQVVLNLVLNAVEAMNSVEEGARELSISTKQNETSDILVAVQDSGRELIRSISGGFSRPSIPQRAVELEWDSRFASQSSPPMGGGCGQTPIDLGAQYSSSRCRLAWRIYEVSSCGLLDSRAERMQRSRWLSSTGLER